MTLRISGKSISVGDALRGRVSERTDEVLRKYFDGNYSGHITLSKDGSGLPNRLRAASGFRHHAGGGLPCASDAYASADQALLMIEKRLRRYKSRLKDRSARKAHAASRGAGGDGSADAGRTELCDRGAARATKIWRAITPSSSPRRRPSLKRLSVSEAVMELDLTGAVCLVFHHGSSGRVNIIYRRADGNVGWIDPPAVKAEP